MGLSSRRRPVPGLRVPSLGACARKAIAMRNPLPLKTSALLLPAFVLVSCVTPPAPPPVEGECRHELGRAETQFLVGDFADAEALYGGAVARLSPGQERTRALYWRGVCRLKLEHAEQAADDFKRCLAEPGGSALEFEAREGLADCARQLGRFRDAAEQYARLARDMPPSRRKASLLYRLGTCHLQAGDAASARDAFDKATELDPSLKSRIPDQPTAAKAAFAVQVGVFSHSKNAREMAGRLTKAGLPAEVLLRRVGGKRLQAVWSGRFDTEAKAQRHAAHLKRIGFDAIVVP